MLQPSVVSVLSDSKVNAVQTGSCCSPVSSCALLPSLTHLPMSPWLIGLFVASAMSGTVLDACNTQYIVYYHCFILRVTTGRKVVSGLHHEL